MAKLLITGGAGFIGSNFIRYILRKYSDWELFNLDKLTYAGNLENLKDLEAHPCYHFFKGDIAERKMIDRLFGEEHFDVLVNFATESHVDRSILNASPFIETNVKGTQVLLKAAHQYKISRFIQISTDEVYSSIDSGKFREDSPLRPNSPYAASKAAAGLLCIAYYKTYRLPVIIIRSSNNYGPYQFPEKLIPLMIINALQGKPLPVYGKGENIRDWLYVEDNCKAIALLIEKGQIGEIYNVAGGKELRNLDFVKDRPAHDFRYSLDCTKIQELGWRPEIHLEDGLARIIDWYLAHRDWIQKVITSEYQEYYTRVYEKGWQ